MSDARQRDPTRLVKDVLGIFGHSKANTTVNVYMQEIEEGIKQTPDAIYPQLTATLGEQKVSIISHGIVWRQRFL